MIECGINPENYPNIKKLFDFLESKLENPNEVITQVDLNSINYGKDEYDYYKANGIGIILGADCSAYFKNIQSLGIGPSSYGWTNLNPIYLRKQSAERLEYLLSKDIFQPFRFEVRIEESPIDVKYATYRLKDEV